MKLLLSLSLIGAIALGDEIERIESIVKDVSVLRQKYESCHEALEKIEAAPAQCEVNKLELIQRHQELLAWQQKYDALSSEHEKIKSEAQKRTEDLQGQLASLNARDIERVKLLETAQKRLSELETAHLQERQKTAVAPKKDDISEQKLQQIDSLKAQIATLRAEQHRLIQELEAARQQNTLLLATAAAAKNEPSKAMALKQCENTQIMPKLVMKPGYESLQQPGDVVWENARTYRMNKDAPIYDAPNGLVVETWEARRSFTSLQEREGWIRITGYFVDRVWKSARERYLWVKAEDATLR